MSNHTPRIIPPHALVEITCVVLQNRYLLRPSEEVNDLILGVLGEAQRKYDMRICSVNCASSHFHMLIVPRDSQHMASFMDFLNGNIAKEIGGLHDWPGKFWHDRYHHIVVSDEEVAQVSRLEYHLGHGVKEGLVDRVDQWPGVHCAKALLTGEPLVGHWYDRSQEYAARQLRGEDDVDPEDYAREVQVVLEPLPCWKDQFSEKQVRDAVQAIVTRVEKKGAAKRKKAKTRSLGVRKILAMDPHHRPKAGEKKPKPMVHAISRESRQRFREWFRDVLQAYREAAERLAEGFLDADFPEGSFPSGLPYPLCRHRGTRPANLRPELLGSAGRGQQHRVP